MKLDSFAPLLLVGVLLDPVLVAAGNDKERIGVLYSVHGGAKVWSEQASWDTSLQIFNYDANSFVYNCIIWNSGFWPLVLTVGHSFCVSNPIL